MLSRYKKVEGGRCFRCSGSGVDPKELLSLANPIKTHWETTIAGRKVVLTAKRDPNGRFEGYHVYIDGIVPQGRIFQDIRKASTEFKALKEQLRAANK